MATCPNCQAPNPDSNAFCAQCGTKLQGTPTEPILYPPPLAAGTEKQPAQSTGMATASLVLGIFSVVTCGGACLLPVLGVIFGIVDMSRCGREGRSVSGLAVGGTATSAFALALSILVLPIVLPRILGARQRANEANSRGCLDQLRMAVKEFEAEVGAYPVNLVDVQGTSAPAEGIFVSDSNVEVRALTEEQKAAYRGPYIDNLPPGQLPICKLNEKNDAATWVYSGADAPADKVGNVTCGVLGSDASGTPYSDW